MQDELPTSQGDKKSRSLSIRLEVGASTDPSYHLVASISYPSVSDMEKQLEYDVMTDVGIGEDSVLRLSQS